MIFDQPVTGAPPRPVALWVSLRFATLAVDVSPQGIVTAAPPIARWAIGKHFGVVYRWALNKRQGHVRFAWLYDDGTVGTDWRVP